MEIEQRLTRLEDTVRLLHEAALYAERTKVGRLNPIVFGFPFELHRHSYRNPHGYREDAETGEFKTSRMFFKISTVPGTVCDNIVPPRDIADLRLIAGKDTLLYLRHNAQDSLTVDEWVRKALSVYRVTEDAVTRVDVYDRPLYFPLNAFVEDTGEARCAKLRTWLRELSPAWRKDICLGLADARLMDELGVARMLRELAAVL